jgi:hypothetical protein
MNQFASQRGGLLPNPAEDHLSQGKLDGVRHLKADFDHGHDLFLTAGVGTI